MISFALKFFSYLVTYCSYSLRVYFTHIEMNMHLMRTRRSDVLLFLSYMNHRILYSIFIFEFFLSKPSASSSPKIFKPTTGFYLLTINWRTKNRQSHKEIVEDKIILPNANQHANCSMTTLYMYQLDIKIMN